MHRVGRRCPGCSEFAANISRGVVRIQQTLKVFPAWDTLELSVRRPIGVRASTLGRPGPLARAIYWTAALAPLQQVTRDQPQDGKGAGPRNSADAARPSRRGGRVKS